MRCKGRTLLRSLGRPSRDKLTRLQSDFGILFQLPGNQELGACHGGAKAASQAKQVQQENASAAGQQSEQPGRPELGQRQSRLKGERMGAGPSGLGG